MERIPDSKVHNAKRLPIVKAIVEMQSLHEDKPRRIQKNNNNSLYVTFDFNMALFYDIFVSNKAFTCYV